MVLGGGEGWNGGSRWKLDSLVQEGKERGHRPGLLSPRSRGSGDPNSWI